MIKRLWAARAVGLFLVVAGALAWWRLGLVAAACQSPAGQFDQAFSSQAVSVCATYGALHAAAGWVAVTGAVVLLWSFLPRRPPSPRDYGDWSRVR